MGGLGTRRRWAGAVAGLGAGACSAATTLPWARSGATARSSYSLLDVAERAGVLPEGLGDLAATWYLIPSLTGLALLLAALGRRRTAGAATATLGILVGCGALLVLRSPLPILWGAWLALGAAPVAVVGGVAVARDRPGPTEPTGAST